MLNTQNCLPLFRTADNMVINEKEDKLIYQFQFIYMLNPGLNINKAIREQVEINISVTFSSKTIMSIRKLSRKE